MNRTLPRILHIISGLSVGGAERSLYNLLAGGLSGKHAHTVVSLSGPGVFGPKIRELGVQVETVDLRGSFSMFRLIPAVARIAADINPDVIQGWMYHGNLVAALIRGLNSRNAALAWNVRHSLPTLEFEKPVTRLVIRAGRILSHRPELILFNSRASMLDHEAFGFSVAAASVIPNGFALQHWYPDPPIGLKTRHELGIPEAAIVIGHVARYHAVKDHATFLRAAVQVARKDIRVHILLSGAGVEIENLALAHHVPDELRTRFHFLGERDDVSNLMRVMDLFCLSSASEAFPNVLGEAMATAVPCVATEVGDCAILVGDTGVIVPARDEQALAQGLLSLVSGTAAERKALGDAARTRVKSYYSLDAVVQQYMFSYDELLGKRSTG